MGRAGPPAWDVEGGGALRRMEPEERIRELVRAGALVPGEELPGEIDPLYLFAELPTLWVARRPGAPSVLVYQGEVYRVKDPRRVIEALGLVRA